MIFLVQRQSKEEHISFKMNLVNMSASLLKYTYSKFQIFPPSFFNHSEQNNFRYSKTLLSRQHWDNSKTGGLANLAA